MANVKISQLPAVSSVTGTDVFPVVATTTTSKLTIKDLANSLPQVTSSISASLATTASYVLNAVSASYAPSTPINTSSFATTGSNNFDGNQTVTGSLIANNLNVKSNLYPFGGFEVLAGTNASSVSIGKYGESGQLVMEVAGDTGLNNYPNFTFYASTDGISFIPNVTKGVQVTGSLKVSGGITGSLLGTASFAISASWAPGSTPINTSSFATTGSNNFVGNQIVDGAVRPSSLAVRPTTATDGGFRISVNNNSGYLNFSRPDQASAFLLELSGSSPNSLPANLLYSPDGLIIATDSGKNVQISSSLNVQSGITGSLLGTASFAVSASWAPGGSSQALALTGSGTTIYSLYPAAGPNFNTTGSILIGAAAGSNATGAYRSVFLNNLAGFSATNAAYSNFIGDAAGYQAANADHSNFIGTQAGYNATNAQHSTFLGENAGNAATHASYSFFAGQNAGLNASSAAASTFIGNSAGQGAANSTYANFIGYVAGNSATNANYANFIGYQAGLNATNAAFSNFIGNQAGDGATHASGSVFIGIFAGQGASSAAFSNFIGEEAGNNATNATYSTFIGRQAGKGATNSFNSIFIGLDAGLAATDAYQSNFVGQNAGYGATYVYRSNFVGLNAGINATNANNSNFIGESAGENATSAIGSTFIGTYSGYGAINATDAVFIGEHSGRGAASANYSILLGYGAGYKSSGAGISSNNIIIGTQITLENNRKDSINIGGIIFATGSYAGTGDYSQPFSGSMSTAKVGINKVNPAYTLDVSGSGNYAAGLTVTGSFVVTGSFIVPAQATANPATGSMYVEPANNRLWVFTGNSATGWVTASLGI